MFKIHDLLPKADCGGDRKHKDRECYVVECLKGTFRGNLCAKCLLAQARLRSKNGESDNRSVGMSLQQTEGVSNSQCWSESNNQ